MYDHASKTDETNVQINATTTRMSDNIGFAVHTQVISRVTAVSISHPRRMSIMKIKNETKIPMTNQISVLIITFHRVGFAGGRSRKSCEAILMRGKAKYYEHVNDETIDSNSLRIDLEFLSDINERIHHFSSFTY